MMDHDEAIRLKAAERYLLDELDSDQREQFEEHLFDCQECAVDVRAGAMFVEQSKAVLAETPVKVPKPEPDKSRQGWLSWLRPAFAMPIMAGLIAIVGYQNLVQIPRQQWAANQMQALHYGFFEVRMRGDAVQHMTGEAGEDQLLGARIVPDRNYSAYILELYDPAGRLQWSLQISANASNDFYPIRIPGGGLEQGTYKLVVTGIDGAGQKSKDNSTIELQIQK